VASDLWSVARGQNDRGIKTDIHRRCRSTTRSARRSTSKFSPLILPNVDTGFFAGIIFKSPAIFSTGESRATGCRFDVIMNSFRFFTAARYPLVLLFNAATLTHSMAIFCPQRGPSQINDLAVNITRRGTSKSKKRRQFSAFLVKKQFSKSNVSGQQALNNQLPAFVI